MAISTPNIESLQAEVSAGQWFHLDPPRHLNLFSPQTLELMMQSLGFRLLELRHFSLEQNPYGWLQSLMNLLDLPENHLYGLLKNTSLQRRQQLSIYQQGKTLLIAVSLLPHCLFLSLAMSLSKRGGTIEAYFRLEDL